MWKRREKNQRFLVLLYMLAAFNAGLAMASKDERDEIARRIHEARHILKALPPGERMRLQLLTMEWPLMLRDAIEISRDRARAKLPSPSPAAIDRMDEALAWLLALARHDAKLLKAVWLICAEGYKVSQTARLMRCARKSARTWCDAGLDRIAAIRQPARP